MQAATFLKTQHIISVRTMTEQDIIKLQNLAESGSVQFKERIVSPYEIGCEMVAFSNSHGGRLVIGINDKTGTINGLSYVELQETTNLLSNIASMNVLPGILIEIENVQVKGGAVVVTTIPEGKNKPYHDNKGIIWVKNGTDKRKVFDNTELAEMMSNCGSFYPDEAAVDNITVADLDPMSLKTYLQNRFADALKNKGLTGEWFDHASADDMAGAIASKHNIEQLLRNLHFILPNGKLTVTAVLLFARYTQRWLPVMTAKCIWFAGNSVGGTQFLDKMDDAQMEGNLLHQYNTIMDFFKRGLRNVQVEDDFNSRGQLEIPYTSLMEFTVNALVHRSLNRLSPIRIFIFDNRVEIHSPGELPGGLSVADIEAGTSMPRNPFLFNNAVYLLPYTGAGSGIRRALETGLSVKMENNTDLHEFLITIPRKTIYSGNDKLLHNNQVNTGSNQSEIQTNHKCYQVNGETHQVTIADDSDEHHVNGETHQENHSHSSGGILATPKTNQVGIGNYTENNYVIPETNQANINHDSEINHVTPETNQVNVDHAPESNHVTAHTKIHYQITKKQKDIIDFCTIPRSATEIMDRLHITNQSANRKKYLFPLIDGGYLEMTNPENPRARNQKYRKVIRAQNDPQESGLTNITAHGSGPESSPSA